jgi:transcriptional regulator with XRE-family HTH domain
MLLQDKIKAVRQSKKLTQTEFGDKIDVGRSYVAQLESGKTEPSKQLIQKLIDTFKLPENYFEDNQVHLNDYQKVHLTEENVYKVSNNHPIFKIVEAYQKHYPEVEYHIKKIEDLRDMCQKLCNPLGNDITKWLDMFKKSDIKGTYGHILHELTIIEPIRQKEDNKAEFKKFDLNFDKLNALLISSMEQAKAAYEGFYEFFKKWVLDGLFIEDVIENERERKITWVHEFLKEKNIDATRAQAQKFYNDMQQNQQESI